MLSGYEQTNEYKLIPCHIRVACKYMFLCRGLRLKCNFFLWCNTKQTRRNVRINRKSLQELIKVPLANIPFSRQKTASGVAPVERRRSSSYLSEIVIMGRQTKCRNAGVGLECVNCGRRRWSVSPSATGNTDTFWRQNVR